jgi:hypothetical protein
MTDLTPKRIRDSPNLFALLLRPSRMDVGMANASNCDDEFAVRQVELRSALHRYASRMVGSVRDGEDVVQEAVRIPRRWDFVFGR